MEKVNINNVIDDEQSGEVNFYLTRTHLFVRQILGKLSYEELVDILEQARKNN